MRYLGVTDTTTIHMFQARLQFVHGGDSDYCVPDSCLPLPGQESQLRVRQVYEFEACNRPEPRTAFLVESCDRRDLA